MLIALAVAAAAAQAAPPPVPFRFDPAPSAGALTIRGRCAADRLEHARRDGVIYRHRDRPAEHRQLGELPDADLILTVYRRDARGCPIIDVVQRDVSTRRDRAGPEPRVLSPQARPERQR